MQDKWVYAVGYTSYNSGKPGPLFIAPHAGMDIPFRLGIRDLGTESVAYYAAKKGGSCIISTMGRERQNGIDFYRIPPTEKIALNGYDYFEGNLHEKMKEYRKTYAFVAKDVNQYRQKILIYRSFWEFISSSKNPFLVFVHAHLPHIKNYPSIMDITAFEGRGFSQDILKEAVKKVNEKHKDTFKKLKSGLAKYILSYLDTWFQSVERKYGKFEIDKISGLTRDTLNANLNIISKYASKEILNLMNKSFSKGSFRLAVENAINRGEDLKVTVEKMFKGKLAEFTVVPMLRTNRAVGIQIEVSEFLGETKPDLAATIIWDMIEECKKIVYKK